MKNCFSRFRILLVFGLLVSCKSDVTPKLTSYAGKSGELIVVVDQHYWDSEVGQQVKEMLTTPQYGLPQAEPLFNVQQLTHKNFGKLFKPHRNILLIEIKDFAEADKETIEFNKSVWANGQLVISIQASSSTF